MLRKLIFITYLGAILLLGRNHATFAQGQSDSLKFTLPSKTFPSFYVAIDPFHMAVGEWKLNVEVKWHKRWSAELDAGYFNTRYSILYNKFVSFSTNQTFIDNKQFYSINEGFGGNLSAKYYLNGGIKKGNYLSVLIGLKNLNYPLIVTQRDEYQNSSPICNDCFTFENIHSNTLSLRIGYGWMRKITGNVIANLFFNLGYKLVINDSNIQGIYYYRNFYFSSPYPPFRPDVTFDNYHIRYYQYLPSFDLGIKIGWAR